MGLTIKLESEDGGDLESVYDPRGLIGRLLPHPDEESYCCLRFIDPYGNTVFNPLQMPTFLAEWRRLYSAEISDDERTLLDTVQTLAVRCRDDRHVYLKFYGD